MLTNTVNNKKYIGQTIQPFENRLAQHKYKSKAENLPLYNSIKKYGWDNFKKEIIDHAESKDDLCEKEIYYINKYDTVKNGYNMTLGGEGTVSFGRSLNAERVVKIKEMIRDTKYTFKEMSSILEVNINTMFSIYYGNSWSHIEVEGFYPRMERLQRDKPKESTDDEGSKKILSKDIVKSIKTDMVNGLSNKEISIKYNISKYVISRISLGKTYTGVYVEGFYPTKKDNLGENNSSSKLTEEDVIRIKAMIRDGLSNHYISSLFNVKPNTISRIRNGKRWSHITIDSKEGDASV